MNMVFGWGKKKSSRNEIVTSHLEKTIKLDEIPKTLDEILSIKSKTLVAETRSFTKKINDEQDKLVKIVSGLEKDDLKIDDIDKHLQILVIRGKKEVISIIKNECKSFSDIKSTTEALIFHDSLSQKIKKIGDALGRHSRVIHIFAKKYAQKLKDILKIMSDDHSNIKKSVDDYKKTQTEIDDIVTKYNEIKQLKHTLSEKETRIKELGDTLSDIEKNIDKYKKNIEKLKKSEQYQRYQNSKKQIRELDSEKNAINNEIIQQFTKISRELGRYQYVSALEKPQKELLKNLLGNSYDAIAYSTKDDVISILIAVRKGVDNGSISVKDKIKSLSNIDDTVSELDRFVSKINDFSNKVKEQEKNLDKFQNSELESYENLLSKALSDRQDAESKIKLHQNELSEIKENMPIKMTDIEIKLRYIADTKFQIVD